MSSNRGHVEELRGVGEEVGEPVEMRGVGAVAGEWPAQQPEMMPVEENSLAMALGRLPSNDLERIVQGMRMMAIDEEAYDDRINAEAVAFVEAILRSRREGNEPSVVVAEQPRFINNLPLAIQRLDDDDQELADLVESSISSYSTVDDDEIRERMVDIRQHDATMALDEPESPGGLMPEEFGIVAEARNRSVSSTDMDGFETAPESSDYDTADDMVRDDAFIETDEEDNSEVSVVHFDLDPPQALLLHGGIQLDAESSNDGDVSGQSSNRSGSSHQSTLNNAFVQPEVIVQEEDEAGSSIIGSSSRVEPNVEAQEVVRRRGVKRQFVDAEDDVRAPNAKRRKPDPMEVGDIGTERVPEVVESPDDAFDAPMEADEFPDIPGLDFPMPEEELNADDVADHRDEAEIDDVDIVDEEPEDEESEDVPHNVNLEEQNMPDLLRQQLPTLVTQQDLNCCIDQKLTQNAMHAALMHEVSTANVVEDGVVLMHPAVYIDASAGNRVVQNIVHNHLFFRNASWIIVPMLNNSGTPSEHWSIGCLNMEKRDLIVHDSQVPSKCVKDERIEVMRRILTACIGGNEADLLKYRYAYRNRCNQQGVGEEHDDGLYCIYHARRWLKGDIVVTNNGSDDDCDTGSERQRLRIVLESLSHELQGYVFRPLATPPPVFNLPPPPQPQGPYHVIRRDHRVTQGRIRDCYRRMKARA